MLARAHTFTIEGLQPRHVIVEVDIRPGLIQYLRRSGDIDATAAKSL
ncbi:MAG TPA: hypothetical protein VMU55_04425 [Solirubrobacteraceae bacterium]|nr:hypothetical protein [Solirubrobacteraceae bacterium]